MSRIRLAESDAKLGGKRRPRPLSTIAQEATKAVVAASVVLR